VRPPEDPPEELEELEELEEPEELDEPEELVELDELELLDDEALLLWASVPTTSTTAGEALPLASMARRL
jgi:hypothetical protein